MRKSIDEALAEAAIRDIQISYCRGLDRLDTDIIRNCFHVDATINLGPYNGDLDGFIAGVVPGLAPFAKTAHFTCNQLCRIEGDVAWAEHYVQAYHHIAADENGPERDFLCFERYIDRVECRDGDWRIARRVLVIDWSRTDAAVDEEVPMDLNHGTRDSNDPSWSMP